MFTFLIVLALVTGASAMEFQPRPIQPSEAEVALEREILGTLAPMERVRIAQRYLENHPSDVPMGRFATDVLRRSSDRREDAIAWLREFAANHSNEIGPQYNYARIADDTLVWDEKARWALAKDSTSNWAWLMWMAAEWHKSRPDLERVVERIERAMELDPSRPEVYIFLGDAYAEQGKLDAAFDAWKAGLVADPRNDYLRQRLEDAKDRVRKAQ